MALRDKDKPLYMISVAAELTGMHPQTLRIYEAKGLVSPKRSSGNTRLYSQNDIDRLELIGRLTDEGINLAGVVRILDMRERMDVREREIEELRERVTELEDQMHEYKVRATVASMMPGNRTLGSGPSDSLRGLLSAEAEQHNLELDNLEN